MVMQEGKLGITKSFGLFLCGRLINMYTILQKSSQWLLGSFSEDHISGPNKSSWSWSSCKTMVLISKGLSKEIN